MTEMMSGVDNTRDTNPAGGLDGLDEQLIKPLWTGPRPVACSSPVRAGCWRS